LQEARTTGAVSISAELFEKLYLAPKTDVSGQLRKTFGNPTPMWVLLVMDQRLLLLWYLEHG